MYYVWKQDTKLAGKYAYFSKEPVEYDIDIWTSGKKIKEDLPPIEITSDEDKSARLTDLLLTRFDMQIFSPRLVQLFEDIGIKNVCYYPVTIINSETGDLDNTYKAARIIGEIKCLDVDNSKCSFDDDGDLMWLQEFRLYEEKIELSQETGEALLIFRLAEFPFILLVEETVKQRLEKEGIVGLEFFKPSDYVGF